MMYTPIKELFPRKYKYVQYRPGRRVAATKPWLANVPALRARRFETEQEAALAVDDMLRQQGKAPVNITTRKP